MKLKRKRNAQLLAAREQFLKAKAALDADYAQKSVIWINRILKPRCKLFANCWNDGAGFQT
ncbi:hypothetical protein ACKUV4_015320 [Acinetobacter baumannii]